MALPNPLPPQFTATLAVSVRSVVEHPILRGGRQMITAPAEGRLEATARVDRQAGTLQILDFPTVSDRVATMIGKVTASVSLQGDPEGTFDDETGHVAVETDLHVAPKSLLARDSDVTVHLTSEGTVETTEVTATGDPLNDGDATLRLVGQGSFRGGTLAGGTFWLILDCHVESVEPQ